MHQATFSSGDGLNIFYRSWQPERWPRAIVIITTASIRTADSTYGPLSSSNAGSRFTRSTCAGGASPTESVSSSATGIRAWIDVHLKEDGKHLKREGVL
jgi:hypothetical protein